MKTYCVPLVLLLFFAACTRREVTPETALFRDFSLPAIVDHMNVAGLQHQADDVGGSESLGQLTRRRRDFSITYLIDAGGSAKFDEVGFVNRLKGEIEKLVTASGARIDARGSGNGTFHLDYSSQGHSGSLEVLAIRISTNQFRVWGIIREEASSENK